MAEKKITITATMEERWVDHFCSMLEYMEWCGNVGHSCVVAMFSDGGGDFRPKFFIDPEGKIEKPRKKNELLKVEVMFDAG